MEYTEMGAKNEQNEIVEVLSYTGKCGRIGIPVIMIANFI